MGQTKKANVKKRWHLHRVRANKSWAVARAIAKYGWNNVHKEVLVEAPNELLNEYEVKFIDLLGTLKPNGYNLTPGGDFNPMDSEEVSARHLKIVQSKDHKARQGENTKAWHQDADKHAAWKEKSTAAQRNPTVRKKQSAISKANWNDSAIRKKRVDGIARAFSNPEVSKKREDAARKAVQTAEFSQKIMDYWSAKREAMLAKLPPIEREKKRKDMEKRRNKARAKYRLKHNVPDRVIGK